MTDGKYEKLSDEDLALEAGKKLKEMKKLLIEIRDLLKTAGSLD